MHYVEKLITSKKLALFVIVLLTLNITKVINITSNIRFNMALSDIFVIFAILVVFVTAVREKTLKAISGLPIWIALIVWISFVGVLGLRSDVISDSGLIGILEELIKTGICILYFIVGYHTLKVIKVVMFKNIWAISTVLFVVGGIFIFLLASKGIFFWSDDPKYLYMFMGTDTDPNHAATFLTLSFFAMGLFALTVVEKKSRYVYLTIMMISGFGIILTGSRGGLIGYVIGVIILFIYYLKNNWRLAISLLCIIMIIGLIFIQVDFELFNAQFTQRIASKLIGFDSGLDIRWSLGYSAFLMGNDYPITGVGRGNYVLNSMPYFEKMGVEFIDNIPHNTYWGLYAEVGLVGFLLFFYPVWLFIYLVYNRYKGNRVLLNNEFEGLVWIMAGAIALAIQAFVLNMENRRFLWYLSGILIFAFQNKIIFLTTFHEQSKNNWRKITLVILCLLLVIFAYVSYDVYIPVRDTVIKENQLQSYIYELPINAIELGVENRLGVQLTVANNAEETDRLSLFISGIDSSGDKTVLNNVKFNSVRGTIFIQYVPSLETKSVFVELISLDSSLESYVFKPICMISGESVYELDKRYLLQPTIMRNALIKEKKISLDDYLPKTDLKNGLESTFSSKLKVNDISYQAVTETDDSGNLHLLTRVSIQYKVLDSLDKDYSFLLLGNPFDLTDMPESVIRYGYESLATVESVYTSTWRQGETYTVDYVLPRQDGIYLLRNAVRFMEDDKWIFLISNEGQLNSNAYLELGWLKLTHLLNRD